MGPQNGPKSSKNPSNSQADFKKHFHSPFDTKNAQKTLKIDSKSTLEPPQIQKSDFFKNLCFTKEKHRFSRFQGSKNHSEIV